MTKILLDVYGIIVIFSTVYHPEGNGIVERGHQLLVPALWKCCGEHKQRWPQFLFAVLLSIRTSISRATGFTPFFLLYGFHPSFSYEFEDGTWSSLEWHKVQSLDDYIALRALQILRRDQALLDVQETMRKTRQRAIDDHQRKIKRGLSDPELFQEGTWVLRLESWLEEQKGNKEVERWSGPYIISSKTPHGAFILKQLDGTIVRQPVHASRLKVFYYRPDMPTIRSPVPPQPHSASHCSPYHIVQEIDIERRGNVARYTEGEGKTIIMWYHNEDLFARLRFGLSVERQQEHMLALQYPELIKYLNYITHPDLKAAPERNYSIHISR